MKNMLVWIGIAGFILSLIVADTWWKTALAVFACVSFVLVILGFYVELRTEGSRGGKREEDEDR